MKMSDTNKLLHRTIFQMKESIAKSLPLVDSIKKYHIDGDFPILLDPLTEKKACIIGMFVLRPARVPWNFPILCDGKVDRSLYQVPNWIFNYNGIDGGGLLANGSVVDAYRLALQYGLSDAVIVGSNTVCCEGVDAPTHKGYIWQTYSVASWPHVASAAPNLIRKVEENRNLWQSIGYLSKRKYPAQIIVSRSGEKHDGSNDFLQARVFCDVHPCGQPIETYIITSKDGAMKIRQRAHLFDLADRLNDILIELSPENDSTEIDYARIPQYLFDTHDMKIINHDGGVHVMREFVKHGAIAQMNLTLCRNLSLRNVPRLADVGDDVFEKSCEPFFGKQTGRIHQGFTPVVIISDDDDNIAVTTFKLDNTDFYEK